MRLTVFLTAMLTCSAALANPGFVCNPNGAVVTLADGTVYYLGRRCDASRKGGGEGRWWLTASAFAVEIDGQARLLPFEVDCPDLPACWLD
ncbi:MAG: hypothetical protein AAFY65_18375 [Pseudomonadota bacterium]